jgi:hypothetical protein
LLWLNAGAWVTVNGNGIVRHGGEECARSIGVGSLSGCDACDILFGQAARAVEESLLAMGCIGKAVLENREDISELERVVRDTRQARREAVENYQSHCATHTANYRTF